MNQNKIEILDGYEIVTLPSGAIIKGKIVNNSEELQDGINAIELYEKEKSIALLDLSRLKEDMILMLATQDDYDDRLNKWLEYHNENYPY